MSIETMGEAYLLNWRPVRFTPVERFITPCKGFDPAFRAGTPGFFIGSPD
jgi:hypothetical protein